MSKWEARLETTVRTGLRWWVGELAALVPGTLRRRFAALRGRLLLIIDDTGAYLAYETHDRREALGRVDLDTADSQSIRDLIASTQGRRPGGAIAVVVRLPPERALLSTVSLPLAAERNLDQVVDFEFERLTPFKREEVYYAYRALPREAGAKRLPIELTVVPRATTHDTLQRAQKAGLTIVGLEVAGSAGDGGSPNLLPDSHRAPTTRSARLALGGLGAVTAALAIVAALVPLFHNWSTIDALTQRVGELRKQAEASTALQKEIDAEIADAGTLIARKRQAPTVTEVIYRLTHQLSNDTWLTELQINNGEVHLSGYSVSATTVLGILDQSPGFSGAAFRSPVTQDPRLSRERFDIAAKITTQTTK